MSLLCSCIIWGGCGLVCTRAFFLPRVTYSHKIAANRILDGYQGDITRLQKFENSSLTLLSGYGNTLFKAWLGNIFLNGKDFQVPLTNYKATSQLDLPILCRTCSQYALQLPMSHCDLEWSASVPHPVTPASCPQNSAETRKEGREKTRN